MTRIISFLFLSLLSVILTNAQTTSDSGSNNGRFHTSRFNIGLSYGHDWNQGISDNYIAIITYEFLKTQQFSLTAIGRYALSETSFSEADISYSHNPDMINMNGKHNLGQIGLTASFRTKLFEKPFIGTAIINSDWSTGGFAKVTSIVMGMIMIRSDKDTQFGLGPMFLINTNGKLPALIAFIYRHRFNDKWRVNLSGGLFAMEYSPSHKDLLSMGIDVNAKTFYFQPKTNDLPDKLKYMSVSFRPLLKYSRNIIDNLNLEVKTGASINIVNRVNGMTGTKRYLECHQPTVYPFINVGASYAF